MKKTDEYVHMFELSLFGSSRRSLLNGLSDHFEHSRKLSYIFTPNPEQVVISRGNRQFLKALQEADTLLPDGFGLVWASWLFSLVGKSPSLKQRVSGREVVVELLDLAGDMDYKVLVIGGRDYQGIEGLLPSGTSSGGSKAATASSNSSSQGEIRWTPGFDDVTKPTRSEQADLHQLLGEFRPQIVFVAFGAPHQELWAASHRQLLEKSGVKLVMAVGGTFDYLLGKVLRVPSFISSLGLEWLFRLITQPWRWRRQLRLISFVSLVIKSLFKKPKQPLS